MFDRMTFRALILCALSIGAALSANAQSRHDVTGVVVDSAGVGLRGATVVALTKPDSVISKFAISAGDGSFKLSRVQAGEYVLQITFVGFAPWTTDLSVSDSDVEVGPVTLAESVSRLDELVVSSDHIPFVVKRDTLEYNAAAFGIRPNASVEDLLRRLPGIEVEDDGSIKAQGEDVQNVLVEGKEFFGSDPTIATKNLPADAVDRVQVYDRQSDMAEFTGIRDGQEEKTINLELRDEAKRGYFGKITGGLGGENGDQERYDGQVNVNRFTPTTQLSVIANINNVNRQGFGFQDYMSFMGGLQAISMDGPGFGSGVQIGSDIGDGFSETLALGLNASHDFGPETSIRSSYFLSSIDNLQDRVVQQQQLLGSDVSSLTDQTSNQTSDNLTHRLNLNAEHQFAEGHDLRMRGNLTASSSSLSSSGFRTTRSATGLTQNSAETIYGTSGDDLGGSARLTWRKKLNDRGRSLVAEARANLNDSDLSSDLASTTGLYSPGDIVTYEEILQEQARIGNTLQQTQRLSLTEPLGRGRVLELFGERSAIDEDQTKSIFDLGSGAPVLNEMLSSGFERTYSYLRGGLRFNRNTDKARFGLGVQVQESDLSGTVLDRDQEIANGYTHILPSANFGVELRQGMNLDFQYRTSTREPSMTELQPFTDNSDPLNVYVGNPALTPEYSHRFNVHYMFFDQFSFVNVFSFITVGYTKDKIVRSRTVDDQFRQVVTSVNSDGGWVATGRLNFGTPIRPLGAKLNLGNSAMYSTGSEFINQEENESRILRNTIDASLENRNKELYDIRAGARLTFNKVEYSLNERLNQDYVNSTIYADGTYYLGNAWTFNTSLNYRIFDQDVFGPGQNVALLEASISRLVMNDRAEIQLVGLDILNQNQGVNFSNTSTYIQEERIESLGRYIMLKVVFHISGFGGRQGNRGGIEVHSMD